MGEGMGGAQGGERGPEGVGAQTQKKCGGPEGWGRNGGDPKGWEPEPRKRVGRPKISRFFFPSPAPHFHSFFSLSGDVLVSFFSLSRCLFVSFFLSLDVFSWNFGRVLVGRDLLGLSCGSPQRPRAGEGKKREILGGPA